MKTKPVAFHGGKLLSFIFKATPSFQTIDGDNTGCLVYRHLVAFMTPYSIDLVFRRIEHFTFLNKIVRMFL